MRTFLHQPAVDRKHTAAMLAQYQGTARKLMTLIQANKGQIPDTVNAADWPERHTCKFLQPGLVNYPDQKALGMLYISEAVAEKIARTFEGKPITDHLTHKKKPGEYAADNLDDFMCGIAFNVRRLEDGWWGCDFFVWDEDTKAEIAKGWAVSCTYTPTQVGGPGEHNCIKYDHEVIEGEGKHIAIVPNPRYEGAIILNTKGANMIKLWPFGKKPAKPAPAPDAKNQQELDLATATVQVEGIGEVKVSELIDSYKAEEAEIAEKARLEAERVAAAAAAPQETPEDKAAREKKEADSKAADDKAAADKAAADKAGEAKPMDVDEESEIEIGGKKVTIKNLANSYKARKDTKNANEMDPDGALERISQKMFGKHLDDLTDAEADKVMTENDKDWGPVVKKLFKDKRAAKNAPQETPEQKEARLKKEEEDKAAKDKKDKEDAQNAADGKKAFLDLKNAAAHRASAEAQTVILTAEGRRVEGARLYGSK